MSFSAAESLTINQMKKLYKEVYPLNYEVSEEDLNKFFCVIDGLYPVFYYVTYLKSKNTYIYKNIMLIYNNGCVINLFMLVDNYEILDFIKENGSRNNSKVSNYYLEMLYKCFGTPARDYDVKIKTSSLCNECNRYLSTDKTGIIKINHDFEHKKYSCRNELFNEENCSYNALLDYDNISFVDGNFYDYVIKEHLDDIVTEDIDSNPSIIKNEIKEFIKLGL